MEGEGLGGKEREKRRKKKREKREKMRDWIKGEPLDSRPEKSEIEMTLPPAPHKGTLPTANADVRLRADVTWAIDKERGGEKVCMWWWW
jgi:hypothetical protein